MSEKIVTITVDGKKITAPEGAWLLPVCLEHDIYIPSLCWLKEMDDPPASCRLCLVEIEGLPEPVASCRCPVREGMVVRTNSDEILKLRQVAFRLLVSTNDGHCNTCIANRSCELQQIAKFLHQPLRTKRLRHIDRDYPEIIDDHPVLMYEPKKCVLCGRCVYVCSQNERGYKLDFAKRGMDTIISFYGSDIDPAAKECADCLACTEICPVGALSSKEKWRRFIAEVRLKQEQKKQKPS
ncbi:MAG: 4Fe-4S dicluster domain-containing protein [Deltaproteobacteria bacterium]|nr:4Fe-4S dicluster domain-containing protein [Deltaproteobacteria bacterium]